MKKEEEDEEGEEKKNNEDRAKKYAIFYSILFSFACFSPISFIIFFSVLSVICNREQDGEKLRKKLRKKFSLLARELHYIRRKRPTRYSFVIRGTGPKPVQSLRFAVFMVEPAVPGF